MIRKSALVATAAGLLSLFVHFLGISFFGPNLPELRTDGGSKNSVELGNSFEDFTEVTPDPVEPEPAETPEPPVEELVEPERAAIPISETLVASPDPQQVTSPDVGSAASPQPEAPEEALTEPVAPSRTETAKNAEAEVTSPVTPEPDRLAALSPTDEASAPVEPSENTTVAPEIPSTIDEPTPEEPREETDASEQAVTVSKRPRLPDRRPVPETQPSLDGFSSFENLRNPERTVESPLSRYQKEGADPFRTSSARNPTTGRGRGNSNTTNYAGQVLVHLNRAPVVYVPVRGFAQVFFEINPDGSLAWVDIVDSSGSPEIERAAREQVMRAAPFPRPPSGSSRKLSFYYQNG
ncbi:energy transducer TonB [Ruegeria sp. ANG-R]|uniref:energy transducer TonB family protein n=1 Tax=Ruegeria sp. ANG-R TaxID=1577903 RepID=UPI00057E8DFF|nr:energy transducer TonB [Ruegeria sp. ANG-R]KIC39069.1 energy transducer TonB [Ruegeria sp. ANG-R]